MIDHGPREREGRRVSVSLPVEGGAVQEDRAGADINTIVAQYKRHGTLPRIQIGEALYGDFTFSEDLHEVVSRIEMAEDRFAQLPASVRSAADNDWVRFDEMTRTPEGLRELEQAGLVLTDPVPPSPASATPPPTAESAEGDSARTGETPPE